MNKGADAAVAILSAIIGVAIIAVIVGRNSQTASVLESFGNAFSSILQVAVSPVLGDDRGS